MDHPDPSDQPPVILVSACLLGLPTRYDGRAKRSQEVIDCLKGKGLLPIPVCPEQLAGLPTPREKTCFQVGSGPEVLNQTGQVVSASGKNMNEVFRHGAQRVLMIAHLCNCREAILKERSPSCGVHQVYRGDIKVPGSGVTTALLRERGFTVHSEDDFTAQSSAEGCAPG